LSYALEHELEANEDNLSTIDYYLNKLEDDFYSMAEAIGYMTDAQTGQFANYTDNLARYGTYLEGLQTAFGDGGEDSEISQQAFIDGLKKTKDGLIENLESLLELDDTMMEYYGETLAAAGEELEKYTDRMDHLNGVLDHYSDIMGILGKEKDYNAMGVILGGKANNLKNDLAVAKDNLAMYTDEVIYWKE
jgi:hypothetical protein